MLQSKHEVPKSSGYIQPVCHTSAEHPVVEAYLDSIGVQVESAREEMCAHLESLIEANIELGDSQEQAIKHALDQFGKSQTVQRAWKRTLISDQQGSIRKSISLALIFNSLAVAAAMTIIPIGARFADDLGWRAAGSIRDLGIYALPAAAGLFTGMVAKRRPVLATLSAILIMLLPMMTLDALQTGALSNLALMIGRLNQLAIFLVSWIPFGCVGAAAGSMMRRMKDRMGRRAIAG